MDTLVLSVSFEPLHAITWQRAMCLIVRGVAEVVEEYADWFVRSARETFNVPAVIRVLRGATHRKRTVRFSRENLYTRDKGHCQYCGHDVTRAVATYDHVTPRTQGGLTNWTNVVICCLACNQKKGGRTPAQAHMRLLSTPVKPKALPPSTNVEGLSRKAPPTEWLAYLRDQAYWHVALVTDE